MNLDDIKNWILRVPNIGNNDSNGDKHTAACKLSDTA